MKINASTIFSWFFILTIASVPVVQSISEYREKKRILFLDIFTDTFITPHRTAENVSQQLKDLKTELRFVDSVLPDVNSDIITAGDLISDQQEANAIAVNMRSKSISINRYIDDSSNALVCSIDSLIQETSKLSKLSTDDQVSIKKQLSTINTRLDIISKHINPKSISDYFRQVFYNFFRYTVFNQHYLRKYEKEIENSSILANSIRPLVLFANYKLLNNPGDKAIQGKNGWLFYRPDMEYLYKPSVIDPRAKVVDYNSKPVQDDPVNAIVNFRDQLSKMGIDLLVMIVPGKPSIYPDLITPAAKGSLNTDTSNSQDIINILKEKGIQVVDLFGPFLKERERDSICGDSLYLRTDTHWKSRGPRLAASIVAAEIKRMPWFNDTFPKVEYVIDTVETMRNGDIGVMTKLSEIKIKKLQIKLPLEKTKCYQVFSVNRNESGEIVSRKPYRDDFKKARIFILGDSFSRIYQTDDPRSAGWISHLAFEISEPLASIINDGGASTIVRQSLSRKATLLKGKKLVIWQFVERDLRFGAEGWKDIPINISEK